MTNFVGEIVHAITQITVDFNHFSPSLFPMHSRVVLDPSLRSPIVIFLPSVPIAYDMSKAKIPPVLFVTILAR